MSNLKEIRGRISSVKGTLKITSAMRMVSSAKLIPAMKAVGGLLPYEKALDVILDTLLSCSRVQQILDSYDDSATERSDRTAVVLITSNQNLCGSFNANLVKAFEAQGFDRGKTIVYAVGRYGVKAVRRLGYDMVDSSHISDKPDYDKSSAFAESLATDYMEGRISSVKIIYSHFVSRAVQRTAVETFLPLDLSAKSKNVPEDLIIEPEPEVMLETLLPMVLRLRVHSSVLDAAAAEHAARTLAMQTATENGEELLGELSLLYNKLRQQEITSQILDLVGGQCNNQ